MNDNFKDTTNNKTSNMAGRSLVQNVLRGKRRVFLIPPSKSTRNRPLESCADENDERTLTSFWNHHPTDNNMRSSTYEIQIDNTVATLQGQATTISLIGGATAISINKKNENQQPHSSRINLGLADKSENYRQPKRQRLNSIDRSNVDTAALSLPDSTDDALAQAHATVQFRCSKRQKQINYYRRCHREDPSAQARENIRTTIPFMVPISLPQQQHYQLLEGSRIMVVAWLAKLAQEYQHCQVMQSPMYCLLQMQMQQVLQQRQHQSQQHSQQQPQAQAQSLPMQSEEGQNKVQVEEKSQQSQLTQSQTEVPADARQLKRECSMWQTQNEQLQMDYQKERKSKNAFEQENRKLLLTVKALKGKYKKLKIKQKKDYQTLASGGGGGNASSRSTHTTKEPTSTSSSSSSSSPTSCSNNSQSPLSPTSTNKKSKSPPFDPAYSSQGMNDLVPRRLVNDYSCDSSSPPQAEKEQQQQQQQDHHSSTGPKQQQQATISAANISQSPRMMPPSYKHMSPPPPPPPTRKASKAKELHQQQKDDASERWAKARYDSSEEVPKEAKHDPTSHARATSSKSTVLVTTLHDQMQPPTFTAEALHQQDDSSGQNNKDYTSTKSHDSLMDYFMENRVLPPSSQSSASSDATEWHKNAQQQRQEQPALLLYEPTGAAATEHKEPAAATQTETQATSGSMQPSANLLLADTSTEVYAPQLPPLQSSSSSSSSPPANDSIMEAPPTFEIPPREQPSVNLLEGTATEIYAARQMPPPHATVKSNEKDSWEEKEGSEDQNLAESSCDEIFTSSDTMPPPATPKASPPDLASKPWFVDSPPDVQEASQTTFHDGMTNAPRPKETPMTHPARIRLNLPMHHSPSKSDNPRGDTTGNDEPPIKQKSLNPRRVTLSPLTKPIQPSPYGLTQKSSNRSPTTSQATSQVPEKNQGTTNLLASRRNTMRFYTGYTRNLYRQKGENPPMPECVPSDTGASQIFPPVGQGESSVATLSNPPEPTTKLPAFSANRASKGPMEQSWIQNRHYNDFMEDSPPSTRQPPPNIQPKPYVRKVMGAPGNQMGPANNNIRYEEVIRNKAERETMISTDCPDCAGFLNQLERDGYRRDEMRCMCRHKTRYTPPETPEGFWELSFKDEIDKRQQAHRACYGGDDEKDQGVTEDI